jgi:hypothetical protein
MYTFCIVIGAIVFLVISIACFLYAYVKSITKLGDSVLVSTFPDPIDRKKSKRLILQDDIKLASSTFVAFLLSFLPITLALLLSHRLKKIQGSRPQPSQLRTVVKIVQVISITTAIVMLSYGGACMNYLLNIHFGPMLFPVYG